mmetsp:Transcript_29821/g.49863  ORF Transcript_29821/g.49863 Transcript_29821/m.49863 type:complete len:178 (+) Transcript_29821:63-596(+)
MDLVRSYIYASTKKDLLIGAIAVEAFFTVPFVICAFVVASTANAGFNCVLTAFLNIGLVAGSYHVINSSKAPIAIGFLIGSSAMMTLLNFMTAVFWGQLSGCKIIRNESIAGYSCTNPDAYGAVCAFAVFLFLTQLGFTAALVLWRDEFIAESGDYDEVSGSNGYSAPTQQQQSASL